MGRPKLQIDEGLVEKLATIHCTPKEIASIVGCSEDTITGRFSEILEKGRQKGKMSLRRAMFEKALGGNVVMQIWLSKQHLGMSDKQEIQQTNIEGFKQADEILDWLRNLKDDRPRKGISETPPGPTTKVSQ